MELIVHPFFERLAASFALLLHVHRSGEALHRERETQLECKVGQLVLELDILKEAMKGRPFESRTSDE